MAKAYFIGLGGCGLKTVSELYKKLHPQDPTGEDPGVFIATTLCAVAASRSMLS